MAVFPTNYFNKNHNYYFNTYVLIPYESLVGLFWRHGFLLCMYLKGNRYKEVYKEGLRKKKILV